VLTGEDSFLEPFTRGTEALAGDLRALARLADVDGISDADVSNLRELTTERISLMRKMQLLAPVTDLTDHAGLLRALDREKAAMAGIRDLVGAQETAAAALLIEREQRLDASRHTAFLVGLVALPLSVLASLLVVLLFIERLAGRIVRTEAIARQLDEGNPFGEPSQSDDELGRMERTLVRTGNRLVELQDELRSLGTSDALTHLTNRRGFLPAAEHQLEVAKRANNPLALMYLDLDGLKQVNDRLGHPAGDGMLTEAAFVLSETFRASDLIARMGGDEFCVLFPSESYQTATIALARLQGAVDQANERKKRPFRLSFSAGLAMFDPETPCTLEQLISLADEQMYASKRSKLPDHAEVEDAAQA
jgi:diguanylate cyclase (GGDEF)-like protein